MFLAITRSLSHLWLSSLSASACRRSRTSSRFLRRPSVAASIHAAGQVAGLHCAAALLFRLSDRCDGDVSAIGGMGQAPSDAQEIAPDQRLAGSL